MAGKFWSRTDGSMTVEAAIVMPIVISLLLLFMSFAQSLAAQLAMRHAAAETVKEVAAHAYVLTFIRDSALLNRITEMTDSLPAPLRELVHAQGEQWTEEAWKAALLPLLRSHMERTSLNPSQVSIRSVAVPDWQGSGSRMFGIQVVYTHRLHVPFFSRDVELNVQAYERIWTGEGG
ncbi:pilus assembly protein [Xylanibacillus composti]|uniref:TadE-like domain-containing protein n=1 Tax=Xylanibacillus composti TaxID=1572762 RepID=A0A8J4M1V7_9BACL|nr:TadE family protein [Xylanibacillus composti]MDT9724226.1 pilus assembly protein [Xylanibacillus composti]GIQ68257.1 hypothetical protein XYCOK13_10810 [Xylanibacillus composti]